MRNGPRYTESALVVPLGSLQLRLWLGGSTAQKRVIDEPRRAPRSGLGSLALTRDGAPPPRDLL
eukprot:scaffold50547_cov49-Phaeocystis_antarctica.AAC.2